MRPAPRFSSALRKPETRKGAPADEPGRPTRSGKPEGKFTTSARERGYVCQLIIRRKTVAKRSTGRFLRRPQDAYDTPLSAVVPLLPHLPPTSRFVEPCAGNGTLVRHLERYGHRCIGAYDIEPRESELIVDRADARTILADEVDPFLYITNPPWTRALLHPIIFNLYWQAPTWLLFDADWIHTKQARPYLPLLRKIVSVGRVKWIEDSEHVGKDNAAWHLFAPAGSTEFIGRQ